MAAVLVGAATLGPLTGEPATPTAWAAGYTVNDLTDAGDGVCDSTCTLRDAILAANVTGGADTIMFNASGTILLSETLPAISDALTIDGSGQVVAVDGANAFRVLTATAPVTLTALTLQHGYAPDKGAGAYFGAAATIRAVDFYSNTVLGPDLYDPDGVGGGGAHFGGPATVSDSHFISNTASTIPLGTGGHGGGASFSGPAVVAGTAFSGNQAGGGGGAWFSDTAHLTGTTFSGNTGFTGDGGGALFLGPTTIENSAFIGNVVLGSPSLGGGAAFRRMAVLTDTDFINNVVGVSLLGPEFGAGNGGGAHFSSVARLDRTRFISNTASAHGGGAAFELFSHPIISNSIFSRNLGRHGGGAAISCLTAGATITNTRLNSNTALVEGGGLYILLCAAHLDNSILAANLVLSSDGAADIGLAQQATGLAGRHNTFVAAESGSGRAVRAGIDALAMQVALTNTIFAGYAVGVQTGPFTASVLLDGVLWSGVTTPTQGSGISVTQAYTGAAAFVDAAAGDYHLSGASAAINHGLMTDLGFDIDGDARPYGPAPDLGADEFYVADYRVYLPLVTR